MAYQGTGFTQRVIRSTSTGYSGRPGTDIPRSLPQALATVRYETGPGEQTQADFGEKKVWIGGALVRVFSLVAVLGFSRRIFVRAMLSQRQGEWLSGLAEAFRRAEKPKRKLGGLVHSAHAAADIL
jgi:hypothetical protein